MLSLTPSENDRRGYAVRVASVGLNGAVVLGFV